MHVVKDSTISCNAAKLIVKFYSYRHRRKVCELFEKFFRYNSF